MSNQRFYFFIQSFIGGLLAGFALSQGWSFLMPFGLGLLWSSIEAPFAGFLWGSAAVLVSHRWFLDLHPLDWVGVPSLFSLPLAIFIWVLCAVAGGLLVETWSWIANFYKKVSFVKASFKRIILYAIFLSALWGLGESLLSQWPFFWIGVGTSLLPGDIWLAGLARWIGASGLASINVFIGWWIWQLVINFRLKAKFRKIFIWGLICFLFVHILGWRLLNNELITRSLPIAMWQTNIPIREKFSKYQLQKLSKDFQKSLNEAKALGASVLVTPEGTLQTNHDLISDSPITLLTGGFRIVNNQQRSSLLVINQGDKKYSQSLDKYRLVPLGEWLPNWSGFSISGLSAVGGIQPGQPSRLLHWDGPSLAAAICYEISDGKALARAANNGAEWILALANLDPYPISIQRQFLYMAQLRSIETDRDVITVANTGPTSLIDSSGRTQLLLPSFQEGIGFAELNLKKDKTGYMIFGETPLILILIMSFLGDYFYCRK
tara:strand:+ start:406 stop:1878 length:1473 start_codon:yes stop_codon:yes gene_type:complete